MAGSTFAEKALARAAGVSKVSAGDVIDIEPDLVFSHDNSAAIVSIFRDIGAKRIRFPERVAITLDHAAPAPTQRHAQNHAEIRAWVREQGIENFFEVGRGICHQVISEEGLALPGDVVPRRRQSFHTFWLARRFWYGCGTNRDGQPVGDRRPCGCKRLNP